MVFLPVSKVRTNKFYIFRQCIYFVSLLTNSLKSSTTRLTESVSLVPSYLSLISGPIKTTSLSDDSDSMSTKIQIK